MKFYTLSESSLKSHDLPLIYIKTCVCRAPSCILLVKLGNPESLSHSHYSVFGQFGGKKKSFVMERGLLCPQVGSAPSHTGGAAEGARRFLRLDHQSSLQVQGLEQTCACGSAFACECGCPSSPQVLRQEP